MKSSAAFATIVLIWSTTPLGIAWSNQTIHPAAAVLLRMAVAAMLGWVLLKLWRIPLRWDKPALRTYAYSTLGIFGAMSCTYFGAQYIPSGWISILFALAPVTSNLFAARLLGQGDFDTWRWIAFLLSFLGLVVICMDDLVLQEEGWKGVVLLLAAVTLYGLSGVLVQKQTFVAHPLSITVGSLIASIPMFTLSWMVLDGQWPQLDWSSRSPWAVLYLAIFGSLLGFACYFFVVKDRGATAVTMVTLMTPVIALYLGHLLNGEVITMHVITGSALVLLGLVFYYRLGWSLLQRKRFSAGPSERERALSPK
ncbi:MAG: DMT family transporter [Oleiphilaceae bacterium]|nr:DMT family transporter [Oleiphilaceae bacterium]